jgi:hypothetical protein
MSELYYIGCGKIYCKKYGTAEPYTYIANSEALTLSITESEQVLKDYDSCGGGNVQKITRIDKVEVNFTFSDLQPKNLAMAVFGTYSEVNAATISTTSTYTVYKDSLVPLTHIDPASVVITDGATTTFSSTSDYSLSGAGIIIPATSSIGDGSTISLTSYSHPAYYDIEPLTEGSNEYSLIFDGVNLANSHKTRVVTLYKVRLGALKELALKGEDYQKLALTGEVLKDTTITASNKSKYFKDTMVV